MDLASLTVLTLLLLLLLLAVTFGLEQYHFRDRSGHNTRHNR